MQFQTPKRSMGPGLTRSINILKYVFVIKFCYMLKQI